MKRKLAPSLFSSRNPFRQAVTYSATSWKLQDKLLPWNEDCRVMINANNQTKRVARKYHCWYHAVITQPCYGAIHEVICYLFIYAALGATRRNWIEKSKSSSNVTSAKRCGHAVRTRSYPTTPLFTTELNYVFILKLTCCQYVSSLAIDLGL